MLKMGAALKTLKCDVCGVKFERSKSRINEDNNYCSYECSSKGRKKRIEYECDYCGEENEEPQSLVSDYKNNFCNQACYSNWMSENQVGKNHHDYNRIIVECFQCGTKLEKILSRVDENSKDFCSRQCMGEWRSENQTGENHPRWVGGIEHYGSNWNKMRSKTLERDNYKCIVCKRGKEEIGRNPDVHHIKPLHSFDKPEDANFTDNLVTLCRKHHRMFEGKTHYTVKDFKEGKIRSDE